jgi:hypothetical protein
MSLVVQKGFWQDTVIADTKQKLTELYQIKPDIAKSQKKCLLDFWSTYEGLTSLLGDKWQPFIQWFMRATSPETITRCLRALKEDGTISFPQETTQRSQKNEQQWRSYWGNDKRLRSEL